MSQRVEHFAQKNYPPPNYGGGGGGGGDSRGYTWQSYNESILSDIFVVNLCCFVDVKIDYFFFNRSIVKYQHVKESDVPPNLLDWWYEIPSMDQAEQ